MIFAPDPIVPKTANDSDRCNKDNNHNLGGNNNYKMNTYTGFQLNNFKICVMSYSEGVVFRFPSQNSLPSRS